MATIQIGDTIATLEAKTADGSTVDVSVLSGVSWTLKREAVPRAINLTLLVDLPAQTKLSKNLNTDG